MPQSGEKQRVLIHDHHFYHSGGHYLFQYARERNGK
jgi:hypothetical protein